MNKKILSILAATLVAIAGGSIAYSMTWTSAEVKMHAGIASTAPGLALFNTCECLAGDFFTAYDWDGIVNGQVYEVSAYLRNTGTTAVWVTYTPSSVSFDTDQTRFRIEVWVIEGPALPCQLNPITPFALVPKDPNVCDRGYLLNPGKVIKLDIELFVDSVVAQKTWDWSLFIEGCQP